MRRFGLNRWWVLLIASALAIGTLPGLVAPASARVSLRHAQMGGASTDYGDPDVPQGTPYPGRMDRTGSIDRRAGGDSRTATEMSSLRLRIVLELMRSILFR